MHRQLAPMYIINLCHSQISKMFFLISRLMSGIFRRGFEWWYCSRNDDIILQKKPKSQKLQAPKSNRSREVICNITKWFAPIGGARWHPHRASGDSSYQLARLPCYGNIMLTQTFACLRIFNFHTILLYYPQCPLFSQTCVSDSVF